MYVCNSSRINSVILRRQQQEDRVRGQTGLHDLAILGNKAATTVEHGGAHW